MLGKLKSCLKTLMLMLFFALYTTLELCSNLILY